MDPETLFSENLALIDRVIGGVCRRARLTREDAEDFASVAKIALMEDGYAILAKYGGRSSLSTFLTIVIRRLFLNERAHLLGRWHPSAEASRGGEAAVLIETLVGRDGRSLDEALPIVRDAHPEITRAEAERIVAQLPPRVGRPRRVEADLTKVQPAAADRADTETLANDARRTAEKTASVIRAALDSMSLEDRMIVRLRFGASMALSDVSRMMRLPQRPLYRRMEILLETLRRALRDAGIDARTLDEVIGHACVQMDFGFRNGKSDEARRSNEAVELT